MFGVWLQSTSQLRPVSPLTEEKLTDRSASSYDQVKETWPNNSPFIRYRQQALVGGFISYSSEK